MEKDRVGSPALGLKVGPPQPVVELLGEVSTTMPVGSVSEKFTPPTVEEVGLFNVIVKVELSPGAIESGINRFDIVMFDGPMILKTR